ncbi:septum formation topological specificity factor MinE [Arthrobacter bambusae]|nr:septum formation topological specificity factor MinE [Arthrobacter bambusae]MDQ0098757.1 septum formation topological specificity factor MinE [Arthrobacter bambusae]
MENVERFRLMLAEERDRKQALLSSLRQEISA